MSNQYYFFGTRTTFIQAAPKIFCRVNGLRVALQSQEPFIKGINRRGVIFHVLLNLLNLAIDVVNFAIYFFTFFGKRILFFFF